MPNYLAILSAGPDQYAVGLYDEATSKARGGNSCHASSFPSALERAAEFMQQDPTFTELRGSSLDHERRCAVEELNRALQLLRKK